MKRYEVYVMGENVKESTTIFKSLKKAKGYMKKWYSFYKEMDVCLFTLTKTEFETEEELELGNTDKTGINTRTTIFNL